jgi:hypothetical protein
VIGGILLLIASCALLVLACRRAHGLWTGAAVNATADMMGGIGVLVVGTAGLVLWAVGV